MHRSTRKLSQTGLILATLLAVSACSTVPTAALGDESSFEKLQSERVESDQSVQWHPVGPGLSGYHEAPRPHPSDAQAVLIGPDMHVSYGTWDGAGSW